MKTFRSILFWMHLAAGAFAGVVVLIMSVTGVALTYEKQMIEWADRNALGTAAALRADRHAAIAGDAAGASERGPAGDGPAQCDAAGGPLGAGDRDPCRQQVPAGRSVYRQHYRSAAAGLRSFFRTMTSWHRYLAMSGESRATGKGITGAANLAFLFIVISGLYLWLPRLWTWIQFKNVLWFRSGLTPKARDFNWHNVIGVWTAIPLAIVVAGAVPISYPWASNLVYRLAGDTPPPPAARRPGAHRRARDRHLRQRRCRCRMGLIAGADSELAHHDDAPGDVGEGAGDDRG